MTIKNINHSVGGSMNRIRITAGILLMAIAFSAQAELIMVNEDEAKLKESIVPIVEVEAVAPRPQWTILAGEKMSSVLSVWGKANQWALVWDAQEIVSEVEVNIDGKHEFEVVIEMVVDALNRNGTNVRALYYEANHILRITDKKQ